ncbi:MAG TPA: AAA family ATPase, partial [Caulobacteraceae bacterium]|nr:AAA family ATPase [Caulobacteraceae bacterium]
MEQRPADGERRAIRGYSAQYRVAAQLIYDAFLEGDLDWIRLADIDAGRVDDLIIARSGGLDAYQIKWSEFEGRVSFNHMLSPTEVGNALSSPFAQLADGWRRLSHAYPECDVRVHYLARDSASTADKTPGPERRSTPSHFQSFIRHAYQRRAQWESLDAIDNDWRLAIIQIQDTAGFEWDEFVDFIRHAYLDLGFRLSNPEGSEVGRRQDRRRQADLHQLASLLFTLVGDDERIVQLDSRRLMNELGWDRRLDLRFKHEFPVDEGLYRPISSTVEAIESALEQCRGGYVALIGPPGSGKSTTLTQMLRYRRGFRVVRYYAFVRGDPALGRGEADAFLSDLTVALRRSGIASSVSFRSLPETRQDLLDAFARQLSMAHEEWKTTGLTTLIMIDGLDHIEREQHPQTPLFNVLPLPEAVPDGVLFVLGSQRVGLKGLPARIRGQLTSAKRTVVMGRLERRDVAEIAGAALEHAALSSDHIEAIWRLSGGHPLALSYLLKRLVLAGVDENLREDILAGEPFSGDVEDDYAVYWEALHGESDVRQLLGLICRLRGNLDLSLISELTTEDVLEKFVATAAHYFRQETASEWAFFHNSFRQYLIHASSHDPFGKVSEEKDRHFHKMLADAAMARAGTAFGWEALYHFYSSGRTNEVLEIFSQRWFREQFMRLRPPAAIKDDLTLCLRAALVENDMLAFVRALLIETEIDERTRALDEIDLPELLVRLSPPDEISNIVIRDGELEISAESALRIAVDQLEKNEAFSRRLFALAEPIDLLSGSRPLERMDKRERLVGWAKVAWRFHSIGTLVRLVRQIRLSDVPHDEEQFAGAHPDESDLGTLTLDLFEEVGLAILRDGASDVPLELKTAICSVGGEKADGIIAHFCYARAKQAIDGLRSKADGLGALMEASKFWTPTTADPVAGVTIALAMLKLNGSQDLIGEYLARAAGPLIREEPDWDGTGDLSNYFGLIQQARVFAAVGRPMDPVASVPKSERSYRHGSVLFERMLVLVATLRGEADRGATHSPEFLVRRLVPAITLYCRPWAEVRDWNDWHAVRRYAAKYFEFILQTAAAHGELAFRAVFDEIKRAWEVDGPRSVYWPTAWRREVAHSAFLINGDEDEYRRLVATFTDLADNFDDLSDRVSHHAGQLKAWLDLHDYIEAKKELNLLLRTSFGIYHDEDEQFNRWVKWASRAVSNDPKLNANEALRPLCAALASMHQTSKGANRNVALSSLLECAGQVSVPWSLQLLRWLLAENGAAWTVAISGILRGALQDGRPETVRTVVVCAARLVAVFELVPDRLLATSIGDALRPFANQSRPRVRTEIGIIESGMDVLNSTIETKVNEGGRNAWIEGLGSGLAKWNSNPAVFDVPSPLAEHDADSDSDSGSDEDGIEDGGAVAWARLAQECKQCDEFLTLLTKRRSLRSVHLVPDLERCCSECSASEFLELDRVLNERSAPPKAVSWLAQKLAKIDRAKAARLVEDQFLNSKAYGWMRGYDGGTRLVAA